ncbi:MAG: response regulator transcription factor [Burkholderiales bacterium]|nr:response regulator transcription factor [Burkholderiales bacterium]
MRILLVEDEIKIAEFVSEGLKQSGLDVTHASDGLMAKQVIAAQKFDVMLLDVMLPHIDGFTLLKDLRQAKDKTPVIVLSAKSDLTDRLQGFELGADDYLPKPFFLEELVARIKAVTMRGGLEPSETEVMVDQLKLDLVNRQVSWYDVTAVLSQREFMLLKFLMRSPGTIFSRKQILQSVWNIGFDPQTNLVDACIQRIKRKLMRNNEDFESPIESVRGIGYRIRVA